MFATNLKIVVVVVLTLAAYALVANMIPQIQSEVPEELVLSGEVTAEQLVSAGESLYNGAAGCTACHGLGTRAPNLVRSEGSLGPIGSRCGGRVAELDCKEYLYQSLTEPGAYLVEGYAPIMPDARRILSEDQIWALVAFLQGQGGEVTVTAADLPQGGGATQAASSAAPAGAGLAAADDPLVLLNELGCLVCHQLGDQGNAVGPVLTDVGARRDAGYIRESILNPGAEVSPGYEALAAMMPTNFGERMTAAQLETLVKFLAEQR
ncbi:MAG TPA: c-type cytochrome [Pseudomonadales bacterium]